jgi:hypothetical protein
MVEAAAEKAPSRQASEPAPVSVPRMSVAVLVASPPPSVAAGALQSRRSARRSVEPPRDPSADRAGDHRATAERAGCIEFRGEAVVMRPGLGLRSRESSWTAVPSTTAPVADRDVAQRLRLIAKPA